MFFPRLLSPRAGGESWSLVEKVGVLLGVAAPRIVFESRLGSISDAELSSWHVKVSGDKWACRKDLGATV